MVQHAVFSCHEDELRCDLSAISNKSSWILRASAFLLTQGVPTTYNKDFQEAWQFLFETVDTTLDCIKISTGVLSTLRIKPDRMLKGLSADMLATDLAEYLVRKGDQVTRLGYLSCYSWTNLRRDQHESSFHPCKVLLVVASIVKSQELGLIKARQGHQ